MGRIGDIADLVTGLALLGGGYLIYRAVKEAGDIIPEFPVFEWPEFPGWPELPGAITPPAAGGDPTGYDALLAWLAANADIPDVPGFGEDEGIGGGGGGVRNGFNGYIAPPYIAADPYFPGPEPYPGQVGLGGGGAGVRNGIPAPAPRKPISRHVYPIELPIGPGGVFVGGGGYDIR